MHRLNLAMFRRAKSLVTVSDPMMKLAKAAGVREAQLVGTPVLRTFLERPPVEPWEKLQSVLYVGRLAAENNIEAFIELAGQRPGFRTRCHAGNTA